MIAWKSLIKFILADQLLTEPDWELYTDGSSFMENIQPRAVYMVVTIDKVIQSQALAIGILVQKAELISPTRAL